MLDRREQARDALKKHGLTFTDAKGMVRQRPEICIERDSAMAFLRAMRTLRLEPLPPDTRSRIASLGTKKSGYGRQVAGDHGAHLPVRSPTPRLNNIDTDDADQMAEIKIILAEFEEVQAAIWARIRELTEG
jgi:hypothetical protein